MLIEDTVQESFFTKPVGQIEAGEREGNTKDDQTGQEYHDNS